jgi:hypothetical protein
VTFIGQTDMGAAKNAPSISMIQSYVAVGVANNSSTSFKGEPPACTAAQLSDSCLALVVLQTCGLQLRYNVCVRGCSQGCL